MELTERQVELIGWAGAILIVGCVYLALTDWAFLLWIGEVFLFYPASVAGLWGGMYLGLKFDESYRDALTDPLVWFAPLLCFVFSDIIVLAIGLWLDWWLHHVFGFLIAMGWLVLVALSLKSYSNDSYDLGKDLQRSFKIMKRCPSCAKKLPSRVTSVCPHCTQPIRLN